MEGGDRGGEKTVREHKTSGEIEKRRRERGKGETEERVK
jgi:hypothetical protein